MSIKLSFFGAAHSVTGSRYLVEANGSRILVDCGLFQERQFKDRDWSPFPVSPKSIDAILLTHAHLDHSGYLPKITRDGFHRPIYCTTATKEITEVILLDSASLLTEDAQIKKKRHQKEGRTGPHPEAALYDVDDAEACFPLFQKTTYGKPVTVAHGIQATFFEAGHTLGSASICLKIKQDDGERTILFSGDLGRQGKPIIMDPTMFSQADYVIVESTYGDRNLESSDSMVPFLAEHINRTAKEGGNIVIPIFALERSQEILYYLNRLLMENTIPHLMVFMDSPMAISITEIFGRHQELMDTEMLDLLKNGNSPFDFPGLHMIRTTDQSKAINHIKGTVIIMAGSGMCTGGRIKHHLVTNISRPDSSIIFVGYQAGGTLGREIVDGAQEVRIFGQQFPVRAQVAYLRGFSGHADQQELLSWLTNLRKTPRQVFVTHGEPTVSESFTALVREKTGWQVSTPEYKDEVILD
jgi:metallo-beta-lactamase family protein